MKKNKLQIEITENWLKLTLTDKDGAVCETYQRSLGDVLKYANQWFKDIKNRRVTYKTLQAMYNSNK